MQFFAYEVLYTWIVIILIIKYIIILIEYTGEQKLAVCVQSGCAALCAIQRGDP